MIVVQKTRFFFDFLVGVESWGSLDIELVGKEGFARLENRYDLLIATYKSQVFFCDHTQRLGIFIGQIRL